MICLTLRWKGASRLWSGFSRCLGIGCAASYVRHAVAPVVPTATPLGCEGAPLLLPVVALPPLPLLPLARHVSPPRSVGGRCGLGHGFPSHSHTGSRPTRASYLAFLVFQCLLPRSFHCFPPPPAFSLGFDAARDFHALYSCLAARVFIRELQLAFLLLLPLAILLLTQRQLLERVIEPWPGRRAHSDMSGG